jgi:hypothetical protein
MSEHNEEAFGEMAALSRRMARIEIALTERILALENEVAALKGQGGPRPSGDQPLYETGTLPQYEYRADGAAQGQADRTVYPDAREIDWCAPDAALLAIKRIMQRGDV